MQSVARYVRVTEGDGDGEGFAEAEGGAGEHDDGDFGAGSLDFEAVGGLAGGGQGVGFEDCERDEFGDGGGGFVFGKGGERVGGGVVYCGGEEALLGCGAVGEEFVDVGGEVGF